MVKPIPNKFTLSISIITVCLAGLVIGMCVSPRIMAEEPELSTYDDLRPVLELAIFPLPTPDYQAALSPSGVTFIWEQIINNLVSETPLNVTQQQLQAIKIQVEPGSVLRTRAGNNKIVISDAHLRAASLFGYAVAKLELDVNLLTCYNMWFDFFMDALASGDPVIPLDSEYSNFVNELYSGQGQNKHLEELFQECVFGWTAFLLSHEAGHILLKHTETLRKQFPRLPEAASEWPDDAKRLTQSFELEADRFAVDLTISSRTFSARAISAWFQWQAIHHVAIMVVGVDPGTHPPPQKRFEAVLYEIAMHDTSFDPDSKKLILNNFEQLIAKYDNALRDGKIDELFPMRGRPASVTVKTERIVKRINKLLFCIQPPTP